MSFPGSAASHMRALLLLRVIFAGRPAAKHENTLEFLDLADRNAEM